MTSHSQPLINFKKNQVTNYLQKIFLTITNEPIGLIILIASWLTINIAPFTLGQMNIIKTHNIWHTGTIYQQYFGDDKPWYMCNCEKEDWRHVLAYGSLDASLHRAASLGKIRKSMERWHLPPYFWIRKEKGINHYTYQPHKHTVDWKDNEPQKPFAATFKTPRSLLQQEFRTQSHIGWDNFLKGPISRDLLTYVYHNEAHANGHGKSKDWSKKIIGGLW
jgi:hypothetical protein